MNAIEHLELDVDAHHVAAYLTRFHGSEVDARTPRRQPRWMLRIDSGPIQKGPLTWDVALDPETEREAIAAFVRWRKQVHAARGDQGPEQAR